MFRPLPGLFYEREMNVARVGVNLAKSGRIQPQVGLTSDPPNKKIRLRYSRIFARTE